MTTTQETIRLAATDVKATEDIRTWALVALILYVVNGVAYAGFTAAGGVWFTISDAVGLLLAIALMMLVIGFDNLFRAQAGRLSRAARWVGVFGMVLAAAGSIVLLSSQVAHEFVPGEGGLGMQFGGWGLLGVWFILIATMALRTGLFSTRWRWASWIAGLGSVVAMLATVPLGPDSIAVSVGFTVTFVALVFWVVLTRRELQQK